MPWTATDYPEEMKKLDPKVRLKAIEIANTLVREKGYEEKKAIALAITRAEQWAFDKEG
jgi:uncharacterized protein YdaT